MGSGLFGIGGSDSTSSNSEQVGATQSRQTRGNQNVQVESGAIGLGANAKYLNPGSAIISGAKDVTIGDPNAIAETFSGVSGLLGNILANQQQQSSQSAGLLDTALGNDASLAQSAQTGGASAAGDTFTNVLLGALGISALAFVAWLLLRK